MTVRAGRHVWRRRSVCVRYELTDVIQGADGRRADAVIRVGVEVLRRALLLMIDVQQRVFGEPGAPGGALLEQLLRLDTMEP